MRTLQDLVEDLIEARPTDLQLIAEALAVYCPYTAEHLKNYLAYAQQDLELRKLKPGN